MIYKATCHTLSPGAADNMYPRSVDKEHRDWIYELMHTSGGPSESVGQLIFAAFKCAVTMLQEAGSFVTGVDTFNAYLALPAGLVLVQGHGHWWHSLEVHWQDE